MCHVRAVLCVALSLVSSQVGAETNGATARGRSANTSVARTDAASDKASDGSEQSGETSFRVVSFRGGPDEAEVAAKCERLRTQWCRQWLGNPPSRVWTPACDVIVHGDRGSYLQAVGRAGASTFGSSLTRRDRDGRLIRRIDLLVDAERQLTALDHELVHVILAEHFDGGLPPLWLDEGLAMLVDRPDKQQRHQRDCDGAVRQQRTFALHELFRLESPHPSQFATLYGQSLSVTRYLVRRADATTLIEFARAARRVGYDQALSEHYGIANCAALEQEWIAHARESAAR